MKKLIEKIKKALKDIITWIKIPTGVIGSMF